MKFIPTLTAIETGSEGRKEVCYFEVKIFARVKQLGVASVAIKSSGYVSYLNYFLPENYLHYAEENSINIEEEILKACRGVLMSLCRW